MARALAGDKAAYEQLLRRSAVPLRGYFFRALGAVAARAERAEDLVQEVLLTLHRKRDLYSPGMPFLPWLFAIARHRLIDHFRAEKRRPETVAWLDVFDTAEEEKATFSEENRLLLEEWLAALSPRQREILVMAKAEGVPLAEIAARLDMSLSAVKVTVHRAIQKVRKRIR